MFEKINVYNNNNNIIIIINNVHENINFNKLTNFRRGIIRNKRLTDEEIDQIRTQIRNEENVTSDEEEEQHLIENINLEPIVLIPQLNMNEVQTRIAEVRNASIDDEEPESQDNFTEQYSQEIEEARLDILREFSRTEHQHFSERDPLPKITNSAKLNLKIKLYKVALKKILTNKECDLSNLNGRSKYKRRLMLCGQSSQDLMRFRKEPP